MLDSIIEFIWASIALISYFAIVIAVVVAAIAIILVLINHSPKIFFTIIFVIIPGLIVSLLYLALFLWIGYMFLIAIWNNTSSIIHFLGGLIIGIGVWGFIVYLIIMTTIWFWENSGLENLWKSFEAKIDSINSISEMTAILIERFKK